LARYRLTIDTGGTFTDLILLDEETGALRVVKVPSTPDDPSRAVVNGLERLAADGVDPRQVVFFFHGTTVATNALLEERGARVGLAITAGFRGVYETMEQSRPYGRTIFDLEFEKPALLAPPSRTAEIAERIDARGDVRRKLDMASVYEAIDRFEREHVDAVAVCLLFSFMNPEHERRVRDVLRARHPEWRLSVSSDLLPQIREYYRLSTTVINAYVAPVLGRYVEQLERHLDRAGVAPGRRFTMQSNGGSTPLASTSEAALATVLSGPAGGVTAAIAVARSAGVENLLSFDMGGTSCDVALVHDGVPTTTTRGQVDGRHVALRMLHINTVSAGGGTLARVDHLGALHLGPESAGALPGPACYGRGGDRPTVTDADVVLGHLSPSGLLGGSLAIDAEAARHAVLEHVAHPLGVDLLRAADGIVKVVNVTMAEAIKAISSHRGHDVREFALIPFGGAGPVHAPQIAVDLGIRQVIVPPVPGALSALGLMLSDVKHDLVRSRLEPLGALREASVDGIFEEIRSAAFARLREEGFDEGAIELHCALELRYTGQGYEVGVPVDALPLREGDLARYRDRFDEIHRRLHGHAAPDQPVEVVNYRVEAIGRVPRVALPAPARTGRRVGGACVGERPAVLSSLSGQPVAVPVYERSRLEPGHAFAGPAIVEQYDATTLVCPEQDAVVDDHGNLVLTLRPDAA
jgi:N-methylhydantoinase A